MECTIKPIKFNKKQRELCGLCPKASLKLSFCQRWGTLQWEDIDKYPSLIEQAKSFGKAVIDQARAGNPKRSHEQTTKSMRICKQCPSYVAEDERCRKCGCRMPVKIKWATTRCPLNKW